MIAMNQQHERVVSQDFLPQIGRDHAQQADAEVGGSVQHVADDLIG